DGTELMYFGGLRLNSNGDVFISCQVAKPSMTGTTGAIFKVPKGAFDDIEEAHGAGFVVAVAYPNPGKDVLNIRTGLQDARVEVYDVNGRLMHRQDITENVTAINTTDWSEGSYVWKVMADGKEVESGKWIKE
ncbi:MAG: T9SS type A sorting domain-containing protein, partial [Bacteroidales bacterium]|nr:T9SS type A sorting domain-containing protein [Bacteroidales bacterium]